MLALDALAGVAGSLSKTALAARLTEADRLTTALARAGETAGYQLDKLEDGAGTA